MGSSREKRGKLGSYFRNHEQSVGKGKSVSGVRKHAFLRGVWKVLWSSDGRVLVAGLSGEGLRASKLLRIVQQENLEMAGEHN